MKYLINKYATDAQIIVNSEFDTDTSGWSAGARGVLSWEAQKAKFTVDAGQVSGYFKLDNSHIVPIDKLIEVSVSIDLGTASKIKISPVSGEAATEFISSGDYKFYAFGIDKIEPIVTVYGDGAVSHVDFIRSSVILNGDPRLHQAPLHSGKTVTLSGDGKIEVPINATLGNNIAVNGTFDTDLNGWAATTGVTWDNGKAYLNSISDTETINQIGTPDMKDNTLYSVTFTASDVSGTENKFRHRNINIIESIVNGVNSATFTSDSPNNFAISFRSFVGSSMKIDNVEVREITAVQGSVTYWDETTKSFEQVKAP